MLMLLYAGTWRKRCETQEVNAFVCCRVKDHGDFLKSVEGVGIQSVAIPKWENCSGIEVAVYNQQ
jgi:hypothetical protein